MARRKPMFSACGENVARENSTEMCGRSAKFFLFRGCGAVIYTFCGSKEKKGFRIQSTDIFIRRNFSGISTRMYK